MKKLFVKTASVILAGIMTFSTGAVCASAAKISLPSKADFFDTKKTSYVEGEVIVSLKSYADSDCLKKQKAASVYGDGVKLKNSFTFDKNSGDTRFAVLKSSTLSTKELIASLKKNPNVKYAFPNFKSKVKAITNDTYSEYQWSLENNGQNGGTKGEDIKIKPLWDKAEKSDDKFVVAVIDTGIDYNSSEFKDVLWHNPYGNKLLGKYGYDFSLTHADGNPLDDNGHGSHIAGVIAAASGNSEGISGINKKNVEIMSLKAFDSSGSGYNDAIIAGLEYIQRAVELGTKVKAVNCSFGDYGSEDEKKAFDDIFNALGEKGVVFCVAAGNDGTNLNDQNDPDSDDYEEGIMDVPACCDSPYCITVGMTDENGELDDYSNYGDKYVDVAAPGENILSNVSEGCFNPTIYSESERDKLCAYYQSFDGEFKSGDFGYPEAVTDMSVDITLSKKLQFTQSEKFFGLSGKSLSVSVEGKRANKNAYYAFEVPFSVEDENKSYDISFVINSKSDCLGYVFDVPADYDNSVDIDNDTYSDMFGAFGGNDWPHYTFTADLENESYEKAKDRKLIFLVSAKDDIYIDDLAVSKHIENRDDFGRYDFKSGTSMATAFVTGAAALAYQAYPDADAKKIVNIIKNTGKVNAKLDGKIKNNKSLTLDTTEKFPPMIEKAGYTDDGKVKIEGVFSGTNKVYVDDKEVKTVSQDTENILIDDNGYNTHIVKIKVENNNGSDTYEVLLSNKKAVEKTTKVVGTPMDTSTMITVTAGKKAYFIDTLLATIGVLDTETPKSSYTYTDEMYSMDIKSLIKNDYSIITSAAYYDNKIYFTLRNSIRTSENSYTLGYETLFASYDLNRGKLKKLCELPDECTEGSSLGILNGKIYLIGGFVKQDLSFIDSVYMYNDDKKEFELTSLKLPAPRAYSSFIEYSGKLVGFWGADESGELPNAVIFDGKSWKTSVCTMKSFDYTAEEYTKDFTLKIYSGNLGVDKNGVFCNGSFIENYGDTYTYDIANDKLIENKYCFRNDLSEPRMVGTSVIGGFIGFNVVELEDMYDDIDEYGLDAKIKSETAIPIPQTVSQTMENISKINAYYIELDNASLYPEIKKPAVISAESVTLKAGGEKLLTVTNGTVKSWSSSNKKVASVSGGKVTALKKGSATVTALLTSGEKLNCKITVSSNPAVKIKGKALSSKFYSIKKGGKLALKISGKASGVNNAYSSTNKAVAKVISKNTSKTVYIKGYKKGKAAVTVKVNGVSFKIRIKVK